MPQLSLPESDDLKCVTLWVRDLVERNVRLSSKSSDTLLELFREELGLERLVDIEEGVLARRVTPANVKKNKPLLKIQC